MDASRDTRTDFGVTVRQIAALYSAYRCGALCPLALMGSADPRLIPPVGFSPGIRLYSMLVQAAASGLGAAIGRPMLIAHELERRILVPLFDRQEEAPERCCLITTAASRQRPELRAFRDWILREAALPPPAAPGFPNP